MEYSSIASGCVVGTMSTASCAPLADSNAESFCSRAVCCPAVSVPVRSVTRALNFGSGCRSCAPAGRAKPRTSGSASAAQRPARGADRVIASLFGGLARSRRRGGGRACRVEAHRRRRGDLLLVGDREVRLHLKIEHLGREIHRERAYRDVVLLYRLDVTVARHGDAVFGALEL